MLSRPRQPSLWTELGEQQQGLHPEQMQVQVWSRPNNKDFPLLGITDGLKEHGRNK